MHANHRYLPRYDDIHDEPKLAAVPHRLNAGTLGAFASVIVGWFERSRQRRALATLDDQLLRDIGLTRPQAQTEAARPFWSAGKA
jgi:uncharacterized protein YjiS (DUF1127 family)